MATNDVGTTEFVSGQALKVHRSNKPLSITCTHAQHPEAQGQVISGTCVGSTTMNYFMGGLVFGTAAQSIDHGRGAAYRYPVWIRLVFGESRTFDRSSEKDGQPTLGNKTTAK